MKPRTLYLGAVRPLDGHGTPDKLLVPTGHLTTHGVIVGMTGSGKTGLVMVLVEEALRAKVPVLMIDVKGDLANLAYAFPTLAPDAFEPHVDPDTAARHDRSVAGEAAALASQRARGLAAWGLSADDARAFHDGIALRVITPGAGGGGEALHVLSALEQPSPRWASDPDTARASLAASVSMVLRMVGRDPDATRSRDHALLTTLAEKRLRAGVGSGIDALLEDLADPPIARIGAMELDEFVSKKERHGLATALNTLLAAPTFEAWRRGSALDVGQWMAAREDGRTPAVVLSVAHLDDAERATVLGLVMDEVLAWVRGLSGTSELRGLVVVDEVWGMMPPHPANPPTKRALVGLMKQARAFGVGVVVATQNPMDLDYRALSNAGLWWVGRLQTDADRERVVEGMAVGDAGGGGGGEREMGEVVKRLAPRWFVMRDAREGNGKSGGDVKLVQSRWSFAWLRGPMTRGEIREVASGDTASAKAAAVARRTATPTGIKLVS